MRRLIFAMIICFLKDWIVLQVLAADFAIFSMLIIFSSTFPMIDRLNNFIAIFNEFAIWICIISLFLFTDFIPSAEDRLNYGYAILYFVGLNLALNLIVFITSIAFKIYSAVKKALLKRKMKKALEQKK